MQHSYSPTHGPSRTSSQRMSPKILDPAQFSAGAAQTQGWPYDPTRNATTTANLCGQYQSTMQAGYQYPPQAAESPYHARTAEYANYIQTIVRSSNYNVYPNKTQLYQQTGTSYQGASPVWPQPAYYDPLVQSSLSFSSTYSSTSASQSASSKTRIEASKPTTSTSRPRKGGIPDMKSKMNRFRATDMASTIAVADPLTYQPKPSATGEKRKERSPTPDSIRAGAPPEKEAKRKEAGRTRAQNARDKLNSDIAKLAGKLPSHLQAPGNMSSKENIVQAAAHIDEQNGEIARLKEEAAQLRASEASYKQRVYQLGVDNMGFHMRNKALQNESVYYQGRLIEMEARIRDLEGELQRWTQHLPRDSDH